MTRRVRKTASLNTLRWDSKTIRIKAWLWHDVTLRNTSPDWVCADIMLSTVVCEDHLADPDTIKVFGNYSGVFGDGTRLAMPKTNCTPDSSSLKPGSGATEGALEGCIRIARLYTLAELLDYEDTRLKTSSRVRLGLSFAWMASLAFGCVVSFLYKPTLYNPRPLRCLYKPEGLVRRTNNNHTIIG